MRLPRLLWSLALIPTLLTAQGPPRTRLELVGMSSARLARLRPALQAYVDSGQLAGVVAIVLRRGRVVGVGTYRWADLEAHLPLRSNTLFRLGSMTEAVMRVGVVLVF